MVALFHPNRSLFCEMLMSRCSFGEIAVVWKALAAAVFRAQQVEKAQHCALVRFVWWISRMFISIYEHGYESHNSSTCTF